MHPMCAEAAAVTDRELNLRIFQGAEVPRVLFQPRMEPWYAWHNEFGSLPERYAGMSLLDVYDDLGLSLRYVHYYTGMPDPVQQSYSEDVTVRTEELPDGDILTIWQTPHGELIQRSHATVDRTWRTVGFAVKTCEDLKKLRWLCERTRYTFSAGNFARGSEFVGTRGEPQFWVPKSPYQALCQIWMKLDDFIYALADCPREVEAVMAAIDRSYDELYEGIAGRGRVRIVNFGENIHDHLLSPTYFERYLIPWYEKRSGQLRSAGIFTHVHLDGYFRALLPYLAGLPFDGLEALTPLPQGDVSLEEMRDHIGDKILLDGIPAVFFMPTYPRTALMDCAGKVIDYFHPRLVLGISDELPEGIGEEGVERVRAIAEHCRS
jgi:hypothetical protein